MSASPHTGAANICPALFFGKSPKVVTFVACIVVPLPLSCLSLRSAHCSSPEHHRSDRRIRQSDPRALRRRAALSPGHLPTGSKYATDKGSARGAGHQRNPGYQGSRAENCRRRRQARLHLPGRLQCRYPRHLPRNPRCFRCGHLRLQESERAWHAGADQYDDRPPQCRRTAQGAGDGARPWC